MRSSVRARTRNSASRWSIAGTRSRRRSHSGARRPGLKLPRLALPEIDEAGEITRYLLGDGLPGEFPFLNGAYREMYLEPLQSPAIEVGAYEKNGHKGKSEEERKQERREAPAGRRADAPLLRT